MKTAALGLLAAILVAIVGLGLAALTPGSKALPPPSAPLTPPAPPAAGDASSAEMDRIIADAPRHNAEVAAENEIEEATVKSLLRDPASATFEHLGEGCGYVNSRNGFGGMSGPTRYIARNFNAVIDGELPAAQFAAAWARFCT